MPYTNMLPGVTVVTLILISWTHALPVNKEVDVLKELLHLAETLERPSRYMPNTMTAQSTPPRVTEGSCANYHENSDSNRPEFISYNAKGRKCGPKYNPGGSTRRELLIDVLQRIINGSRADNNEYPWMAAMIPKAGAGEQAKPECGATLITDNVLLTAAHCFTKELEDGTIAWDDNPAEWTFKFMANNALDRNAGTEKKARFIILHGGFKKDSDSEGKDIKDDVALIKLCSPVQNAKTICLPNFDPAPRFDHNTCTVTGWGKTTPAEEGDVSPHLREVNLVVYKPGRSMPNGGKPCPNLKGTLCASAVGKDNCQGDSGGPLICAPGVAVSRDASNVQIGVVSHGTGECAGKGEYSVYANTFAYKAWIQEILGNPKFSARQTMNKPKPKPVTTPTPDSVTDDYTYEDDSYPYYY